MSNCKLRCGQVQRVVVVVFDVIVVVAAAAFVIVIVFIVAIADAFSALGANFLPSTFL